MLFYATLNRKESEILPQPCEINKVIELSSSDFASFCKAPLYHYGFIQEVTDKLSRDEHGVSRGLMVLGEGRQDGVFIVSEGYDYARYSAHVPDARSIVLKDRYPTLSDYCDRMVSLADKSIDKALQYQREGPYRLLRDDAQKELQRYNLDDYLLERVLSDRPEVEYAEVVDDEIHIRPALEYVYHENEESYQKLAQEEVDVMCAKHVLWLMDESGEQADFSHCLLEGIDLRHRNLNSAIFDGAKLKDCWMDGISLCSASCEDTMFVDCSLLDTTAEEASFRDAEFRNCDLTDAYFTHSDLTLAQFPECEMIRGSFQNCCLDHAGFDRIETERLKMDGAIYNEELWNHMDRSLETQQMS